MQQFLTTDINVHVLMLKSSTIKWVRIRVVVERERVDKT
jgi:hypothetical protein